MPPIVGQGNGRKPKGNRACLHALLYVLAAGSAWERMLPCFPSYQTVQRRLKVWLGLDRFRQAWQHVARHYEQLPGIHGDQVLRDGSTKPSQKGVRRPALRR